MKKPISIEIPQELLEKLNYVENKPEERNESISDTVNKAIENYCTIMLEGAYRAKQELKNSYQLVLETMTKANKQNSSCRICAGSSMVARQVINSTLINQWSISKEQTGALIDAAYKVEQLSPEACMHIYNYTQNQNKNRKEADYKKAELTNDTVEPFTNQKKD